MTLKIVEIAKNFIRECEYTPPKWEEAYREAETAERIVEWASKQSCLDFGNKKNSLTCINYFGHSLCEACLARKLMEGK